MKTDATFVGMLSFLRPLAAFFLLFAFTGVTPKSSEAYPAFRKAKTTSPAKAATWVDVAPVSIKIFGKSAMQHPTQAPGRSLPPSHPPLTGTQLPHPPIPSGVTMPPHPPMRTKRPRARGAKMTSPNRAKRISADPPHAAGGRPPLSANSIRSLLSYYVRRVEANKHDELRMSKAQQQRARNLADLIIAPCCFTQPVSLHGNKVAEAVREMLNWFVSQNYPDGEIKRAFVATYGTHVLSIPNQTIFIIPLFVAILFLVIALFLVWRWSQRGKLAEKELNP